MKAKQRAAVAEIIMALTNDAGSKTCTAMNWQHTFLFQGQLKKAM